MERHRCKICFRNFGNGRALGGHMRSHAINFSRQIEEILSCSSSQGGVVEDDREDRKAEADLSCLERSPRFGEITTEERSTSPSSTVSDSTTEEDVARCLMMMSRDRWERRKRKGDDDDDDDVFEDSSHLVNRAAKRAKIVRGKYKCEACNKLFKSYQALGGHRASHGKINKADVAARPPPPPRHEAAAEKVHECPFCHRVFASGQALGGHKRSHFMGASNIRTVARNIGENLGIDLNMPAPVDDDINFIGN